MTVKKGITAQPKLVNNDKEFLLVGHKTTMSFSQNTTRELWQRFMPQRPRVLNQADRALYSVELYSDPHFFEQFDPANSFEKWAAVRVSHFDAVPPDMDTLVVPAGLYAVFPYRGKASEAAETYQYIYGSWIPHSPYTLDDRPHMAVMGERYRHEHPDSEEELWIPVCEP